MLNVRLTPEDRPQEAFKHSAPFIKRSQTSLPRMGGIDFQAQRERGHQGLHARSGRMQAEGASAQVRPELQGLEDRGHESIQNTRGRNHASEYSEKIKERTEARSQKLERTSLKTTFEFIKSFPVLKLVFTCNNCCNQKLSNKLRLFQAKIHAYLHMQMIYYR